MQHSEIEYYQLCALLLAVFLQNYAESIFVSYFLKEMQFVDFCENIRNIWFEEIEQYCSKNLKHAKWMYLMDFFWRSVFNAFLCIVFTIDLLKCKCLYDHK